MIKILITFFQFKAMIRDTAIAARIKMYLASSLLLENKIRNTNNTKD